MSSETFTLIVQGDAVAPFMKFDNVSASANLTDVLELIKAKSPQVAAFNFHRDEESTAVLKASTKVSSLSDDDGMKVVYVRAVPIAGENCSHFLAATLCFSRLNH